jgi:hypothetical protein
MRMILSAVAVFAVTANVHAGDPAGVIAFGEYSVSEDVLTVKVAYECSEWLAGFQFDIVGAEILSASGGLCASHDWLLEHSSLRVLGVGLGGLFIAPTTPAEILLELRLRPTASMISFDAAVFSDPNAVAIPMDTSSVIELDGPCVGDLNGDESVNGADIGLFLVAWGTRNEAADIDGNGIVDGADFGIMLAAWGSCS